MIHTIIGFRYVEGSLWTTLTMNFNLCDSLIITDHKADKPDRQCMHGPYQIYVPHLASKRSMGMATKLINNVYT